MTLYRSYRVGDFPDIQISYSSLITPLQALAQVRRLLLLLRQKKKNGDSSITVVCFLFLNLLLQKDPILAKQLFSALFAGVVQEMEKTKPREESARIKEELRVNMNTFLSKSALCFPPFVACVQVRPVMSFVIRL